MRHPLALVAILAVALPGAAAAQEVGGASPDEGGPSETDYLPAADDDTPRSFGGAPDDVEVIGDEVEVDRAAVEPSADTHVVEKGDTLWDISAEYLDNPWYWPRIWSYNPQIENPHWIYPGDEIRLRPDDGLYRLSDLPDVSRGELAPVASDDVSVSGRIGVVAPHRYLVPNVGLVTEEELQESGRISRSWEEKTFLAEGDRIYVEWSERSAPEIGATYYVYRVDRAIQHPEEGGTVGYLTQILGSARVVQARPGDEYVTALIVRSHEEMKRGDLIGPVAGAFTQRVGTTPNQVDVDAYILATVEERVRELGQGHIVFLDKGREEGLVVGNTFDVVRAGDGLEVDGYRPVYDESLPKERIGKLLVVDVQDHTAAALVIRSLRELRAGDRVEMRVATN